MNASQWIMSLKIACEEIKRNIRKVTIPFVVCDGQSLYMVIKDYYSKSSVSFTKMYIFRLWGLAIWEEVWYEYNLFNNNNLDVT